MPYGTNGDLPPAVRTRYSEHCQAVFRNVWNDVHSRTGDEGQAFASAHAAAKKCEGRKDMTELLPKRFNIFSGLLKAYEETLPSGDTKRKLRTTASSTVRDHAGDEILLPAIEQMAQKAQNNMTIFLNHSYKVPEDILGSVKSASVVQRGYDADGVPIVDLDFDIDVEDSNPRAVQTYAAIKNGTQLGTSIGAMVRHATKRKGGGHIIDDLELLEASIVGIPMNPRSWVQYAMKSLSEDGSEWPVEDEMETIELAATCPKCGGSKGSPRDGCKADFHGNADTDRDGDTESDTDHDGKTGEELVELVAGETPTPEPDLLEGRTRVTVTVDSDAQDAPKSTPENAQGALTEESSADSTAAEAVPTLGDSSTKAVENLDIKELVGLVHSLTERFATVYGENERLTKELEAARADRDETVEFFKQVWARVERLPLQRKTALTPDLIKSVAPSRAYGGVLDAEVIKLLERKK